MSQEHADWHPEIDGSLPGPSRTITVEPLRRPRTPDLPPAVSPSEPEPAGPEPNEPERDPVPVP